MPALQQICIEGYSKSFYDHWDEGGLQWYLDREFKDEKLISDLKDSTVSYYFIILDNTKVGFIKIKNNSLPQLPINEGVELEKFYILPKYKGMGIGKVALNKIIERTKERKKKILFLCVIDSNTSAISFYKKLGFTFHSKTRLDVPYFKEELKGMHRMFIELY